VRTQDRLGVTVTAPGKQFEGAAAVRIGTAIVASGRHRCTVTIIAPTRRGSLAGGSRLATTPPPQRPPWPIDQRRTCRLGSMLAEAHRQKKAPGVPGHPVVSNKGETLEGGQRPHPPLPVDRRDTGPDNARAPASSMVKLSPAMTTALPRSISFVTTALTTGCFCTLST